MPRKVDEAWVNSFSVVKHLRAEIFSDVYLVKMESTKETKLLRKIKKMVFKEPLQGLGIFRSMLNDMLQLEHPNLPQLKEYREDQCNFYLVFEGGDSVNLFE
jgi:hypothetical protein